MRVRVVTQPFKADDGSGDALAAALILERFAQETHGDTAATT